MLSERTAIPEAAPPASEERLHILALSVLALVQAAVVISTWDGWITGAVSVALAITSVYVPVVMLRILAPIIVVNFVVHLLRVPTPIPFRLAHVIILAGYGAVGLAEFLAIFSKRAFATLLKSSGILAGVVVAVEAVIPFVAPASIMSNAGVQWTSSPALDRFTKRTQSPYATMVSVYPDNPRGYFDNGSISYALNAFGCRGGDYEIPKPLGRRRILVLGSSTAFGEGVREQDTFAQRLERSLRTSGGTPAGAGYDVINCASVGLSTREQRDFYENIASRYEPDVVVVAVSARDNLSRVEEWQQGFVRDIARYEYLLSMLRLIQYWRHPAQRTFEPVASADQLVLLNDACRARSARLVVVTLPDTNTRRGEQLAATVTTTLQPLDVPTLDLGPALLKAHAMTELVVHPMDDSLNDVAHGAAADEIERLLRRLGLV